MNNKIKAEIAAEKYADEFWDRNSLETLSKDPMTESLAWDAAKVNFENGYNANSNQYSEKDILDLLKYMNECGFKAEPDIWTVYGIKGGLSEEEGEFEYTNEQIFNNWLKLKNEKL